MITAKKAKKISLGTNVIDKQLEKIGDIISIKANSGFTNYMWCPDPTISFNNIKEISKKLNEYGYKVVNTSTFASPSYSMFEISW
jgi:hypothetical protein